MVRAPLAHVASHATIACIGPVTSAAARESGLTVHVEPGAHTTGGMLAALETYWAPAAPVPGVR
jgi:uroporphyrinogen III methyltransferase/synthase